MVQVNRLREELYERNLGHGFAASLAREEDMDGLSDFLSVFGFSRSNAGAATTQPFYVSPSLPLGAYSETDIRSHLFKYTAAFFVLRKGDALLALLSFRFPLPQYYYRAIVLELILTLHPETVRHPVLSELLNFAFDCLPCASMVECTKVKSLVVRGSKGVRSVCDFFIHNGFAKETTLKDEFGPKRDVIVFARWLSQSGH